jgi:hypothetical protein
LGRGAIDSLRIQKSTEEMEDKRESLRWRRHTLVDLRHQMIRKGNGIGYTATETDTAGRREEV